MIRASELVAGTLALWAGLSILWSSDQGQGLFQLSHVLLALVAYCVVARLPDSAVRFALLPGVSLALLAHFYLCWDLPKEWYGGFGNKNFGAEFVMAAIPLAAISLWGTRLRYLGIAIAAAGFVSLFTVYAQANAKFVVALVMAFGIAGWMIWRRLYLLAGIVILGPIDAMVLYGFNIWTISSLRTRIEVWTNSALLWLEKPFFGHGFGSFNLEYARGQENHLGLFPGVGTLIAQPAVFIGAAHNEPLQIMVETGLVGLTLAVVFLVVLIRRRLKTGPLTAMDYGAGASVMVILGSGLTGFPLQNPATVVLAVLALGLLARREPALATLPYTRPVGVVLATVLSAGLIYPSWLHYKSRVAFADVRARMEANDLGGAFVANLRAIEILPQDWIPRFQLALTLTALAVHDRNSSIEPGAADQVFRISETASPYSPAVHYARIAYLEASGRVDERADEIEGRLAYLRQSARLQPSTWLTELWFAQRQGDVPRAGFAQLVASDPRVMSQAGHDYPIQYRKFLDRLAMETRAIIEKDTP